MNHEVFRVDNLMYDGCEPHWKCKHCGICIPFHCFTKEQLEQQECPDRNKPYLVDFLVHKTETHQLCVIRDGGWTVATVWIDSEDLFTRHIDKDLRNTVVVGSELGEFPIYDSNKETKELKIPVLYVDVKQKEYRKKK